MAAVVLAERVAVVVVAVLAAVAIKRRRAEQIRKYGIEEEVVAEKLAEHFFRVAEHEVEAAERAKVIVEQIMAATMMSVAGRAVC